MSKYTTEVRFICEQQAGMSESKGYFDIDEIIDKARPKIFDFPYPIFSDSYKPTLEKKILMHYYTREISEETYSLWKLRLRSKLNEIMPYYNQLYNSELIKFNPLWDTDLDTDRDIKQDNVHEDETITDNNTDRTQLDHFTTDGQDVVTTGGVDLQTMGGQDVSTAGGQDVVNTTRNDKTNTWDLYSDTPQGAIAGIEGAEDSPSLGDNGYLTDARHVFGDTDGSESEGTTDYGRTDTTDYGRTSQTDYGKTNTTDYGKINDLDRKQNDKFNGNVKTDGTRNDTIDFFEKVTGYRGRSPSESLLKFRETFLNIDEMIIKDLRPLFFNLW